MPKTSFLRFSVGTETFCMSIHEIQFVVPIEKFLEIPRSPSLIKGVSEVHGNIITLIELSQIYGINNGGTVPFHAALLASPFNNMAICLYSDFGIVESPENVPLNDIEEGEQNVQEIPEKRIKIEADEWRFIKAIDLFHLCEGRIKEHVKKNLQKISPGEGV